MVQLFSAGPSQSMSAGGYMGFFFLYINTEEGTKELGRSDSVMALLANSWTRSSIMMFLIDLCQRYLNSRVTVLAPITAVHVDYVDPLTWPLLFLLPYYFATILPVY